MRKYGGPGLRDAQGAGAMTVALSGKRRRMRGLRHSPGRTDGETHRVRAARFGVTLLHGAALGMDAAVRAVRKVIAFLRGKPDEKGGLG